MGLVKWARVAGWGLILLAIGATASGCLPSGGIGSMQGSISASFSASSASNSAGVKVTSGTLSIGGTPRPAADSSITR
jgi:hypothetical protein